MSGITEFITCRKASGGFKQANSQLFLTELCAVFDSSPPKPARSVDEENVHPFKLKVCVSYEFKKNSW